MDGKGSDAADRRFIRIAVREQHGSGLFLAVAKGLHAKSGSMILCQLRRLPKQVFEITQLIGLFPVYDSTDAAVASLS